MLQLQLITRDGNLVHHLSPLLEARRKFPLLNDVLNRIEDVDESENT